MQFSDLTNWESSFGLVSTSIQSGLSSLVEIGLIDQPKSEGAILADN